MLLPSLGAGPIPRSPGLPTPRGSPIPGDVRSSRKMEGWGGGGGVEREVS